MPAKSFESSRKIMLAAWLNWKRECEALAKADGPRNYEKANAAYEMFRQTAEIWKKAADNLTLEALDGTAAQKPRQEARQCPKNF